MRPVSDHLTYIPWLF